MKKLTLIFATIFISLIPFNGFAQFEGLFGVNKEEVEKAEKLGYYYSYRNDEYSKQGHCYSSAKKVNAFIKKDGKVMGDYTDCELEVISGMSLKDETLKIAFPTYSKGYPEGKDFDKYAKVIMESYSLGLGIGLGEKTGLTLTMDMGGFVNGRVAIEESFTFSNASVVSSTDRVTIEIPLANVNMSGSVKQRIAKIRKVLSTKSLFQVSMDGWLYRLKDFNSQGFFKPVLTDLEKKRPVKESGGSYSYNKGTASKKTAKINHSGTQNYIPTADATYMSKIKESIKKYAQCRTGAITKSGPGVEIWGTNGYSTNEYCNKDLVEILRDCNKHKYTINDVAITESGGYLVVFEDNRTAYFGIGSEAMVNWLIKYRNDKKKITSVAFTDEGRWAIVTETSYIADEYTLDVMDEARAKYGYINSVSLSGNSVVVCCDGGVYYKNAPKKLIERLNIVNFLPKVIKFTDNGLLLITDGDKQFDYFL